MDEDISAVNFTFPRRTTTEAGGHSSDNEDNGDTVYSGSNLVSPGPLELAPPFEAALREHLSSPEEGSPYDFGFFVAHTKHSLNDKAFWYRYLDNILEGMAARWKLEPEEKRKVLSPFLYAMKFSSKHVSVDAMRRAFVRANWVDGEDAPSYRDPTLFKYALYVDEECLQSFREYEAAMAAEGEGEVPVAFVKAIKCYKNDEEDVLFNDGSSDNDVGLGEGEIREDKGWMTVDCRHVLMFWDRVSKGLWDKEYARFARTEKIPWWDRPSWFY